MEEYKKWLIRIIETCLNDKDLQREHWAFCQALSKLREMNLISDIDSDKCHHLWSNDSFDQFGFLITRVCDKCGLKEDM
jgi:hypothetical protein